MSSLFAATSSGSSSSCFLPSPILKHEAIEDGTDRLFRNVGNLPFNDA
jgi:hypothetical protein